MRRRGLVPGGTTITRVVLEMLKAGKISLSLRGLSAEGVPAIIAVFVLALILLLR